MPTGAGRTQSCRRLISQYTGKMPIMFKNTDGKVTRAIWIAFEPARHAV